MESLQLKPGRERRVLQGHRWVFSNEIAGPPGALEPGDWVDVYSAKGAPLGVGYFNPRSLIAVRLFGAPGREPGPDLFRERLRRADRLRREAYPDSTCYRVVFGESDGLPGLVVDRYGGVLVSQIMTAGMERLQEMLHGLLVELFSPEALVFRNDSPMRSLEGLALEKKVVYGDLPTDLLVEIDGLKMGVDVLEGQKTGLYLDQRDNRRAFARWVRGKEVLDLFCYQGAWGLTAALHGAAGVSGVDQSGRAVSAAERNAERNGVGDLCGFEKSDVLGYMKSRVEKRSRDVVVLDPPAFAKSKKDLERAAAAYTDVNRRAMLAVKPGGVLVSCSCSHHLRRAEFEEILVRAGKAAGRTLRLLEARGQALDHPELLAMPETSYLKCYILQVD